MYGLRNSELSTCLFQFSHETRQTMLLYAYFTPKVDFKRKFNHHQSSLSYEWRLTARTIRKFRIGPSIRIESRIGCTIRNRIESRSFTGPYWNCQGVGGGWSPSSCLQTLILEWKSAINSNPWAKFQTFRQLTPPPVLLGQFQHCAYVCAISRFLCHEY